MKDFIKTLTHTGIRTMYRLRGNFISCVERPIKAKRVGIQPRALKQPKPFAVVIQGPLKHEDNFTVETVRLYQQTLLPSTQIIISTWEDENEQTLQALRALGVHVLTNKKPDNNGILNINFQLASVQAAIRLAQELGAEYVLKTRTDTRMYASNVEAYLCGLLEVFPAHPDYDQKKRIVGLSFNSNLYRMYNISDIVVFGHMNDMERYWNVPFDTRTQEPAQPNGTLREWSEARMVETYLCTHYLESIGRDLTWTVHDSFQALADHFIIIDEQSLDLFWYKYGYWQEYRKRQYASMKNDVYITFRDWVALYNGIDNLKHIPEHAVEQPLGTRLD